MEAPDKVFFPNDINLLTKLSLVLKQEGDICYIRMDTLLKYLRNEFAIVDFHLKGQDDPVWWGQRNAFQQVIDKIESL